MSLADVAEKSHVSAATLSRVERDKQAIGVELFLVLARILNTAPAELLDEGNGDGNGDGALAARIGAMQSRERTELWRQLSDGHKERRRRSRADIATVAMEIEEVLAQLDFLRDEIESLRKRISPRGAVSSLRSES